MSQYFHCPFLLIILLFGHLCASAQPGEVSLLSRIDIPDELLVEGEAGPYGGDIRIGDVNDDQRPEFLVYRCAQVMGEGDSLKPCYIALLDRSGTVLWQVGNKGVQPARPGPVLLYDLDGDGRDEVISLFYQNPIDHHPDRLNGVSLEVRDGETGRMIQSARLPAIEERSGSGPNWVHQRLIVANLRGNKRSQDFVIKLGDTVLGLSGELELLWQYRSPWTEYQKCPAYIPSVGDIDGDDRDEVNGGYFLLDDDGSILWEEFLGPNMDSVAIAEWDAGHIRAIFSGSGQVLDAKGRVVLKLGIEQVPHGQELRIGLFDKTLPSPQLMIRYQGHKRDVMLVDNEGEISRRFQLNESPNNTGMEAIYWNGLDNEALLFNGGMLWSGKGEVYAKLPELPAPKGNFRQGWYHCIPANLYGDDCEEIVVYNPWDKHVFVFGNPEAKRMDEFVFVPGRRTYNARLLD
ncbi:MAG: hypothetical protein AB3N63_05870 [Puniceicoccaceae bacterium]